MMTDDLQVKPLSISSITSVLKKLNAKDLAALEEKMATIGIAEVSSAYFLYLIF